MRRIQLALFQAAAVLLLPGVKYVMITINQGLTQYKYIRAQFHLSKHALPGCPTAFSRTMRRLLLGRCKCTSERTVSLLNVRLSISFSVTSPMVRQWEAHLWGQLPSPGSPLWSTAAMELLCSAQSHGAASEASDKLQSHKLHRALMRYWAVYGGLQPTSKHRQLSAR